MALPFHIVILLGAKGNRGIHCCNMFVQDRRSKSSKSIQSSRKSVATRGKRLCGIIIQWQDEREEPWSQGQWQTGGAQEEARQEARVEA